MNMFTPEEISLICIRMMIDSSLRISATDSRQIHD